MNETTGPLVSAQVLLGSNGLLNAREISSEFKKAGFDVGQIITGSFPITAAAEVFQRFFDVSIKETSPGEITVILPDGSSGLSLPTAALPESLSQYVQGIFFSRPPDFGPGMF